MVAERYRFRVGPEGLMLQPSAACVVGRFTTATAYVGLALLVTTSNDRRGR
jgi:hypothetical protein